MKTGTSVKSQSDLSAKVKTFARNKARKSLKRKFSSVTAHNAISNGTVGNLEDLLTDELKLIDSDLLLLSEYTEAGLSSEDILLDNDFISSASQVIVKRFLKRKHPKVNSIANAFNKMHSNVHSDVLLFKRGLSNELYRLLEDA